MLCFNKLTDEHNTKKILYTMLCHHLLKNDNLDFIFKNKVNFEFQKKKNSYHSSNQLPMKNSFKNIMTLVHLQYDLDL